MSLSDWQVQVGDVVIGHDTKYRMFAFDHEKPDTTAGDQQLPGRDGITFGRDTLGGTVVTIEANIIGDSPEEAFDLLTAWRAAWQADRVRARPGAVTTLTYRMPSHEGVVYGRPRRFTPASLEDALLGKIPVTADWQCADHRWYEAQDQVVTLGTMPDTSGGITWDITWPVTWAGEASAGDRINNAGDADTYPVITFRGPVASPGVAWTIPADPDDPESTDEARLLRVALTLTDSQSITVDCRPWVNTARWSNGGSVAGFLRGDRLADMVLPPGLTEILFSGTDDTGTAQCEIRWRSASSAP